MTAVIVRSSANVGAGARTKASRVLHGVWLLLFVLLAPGLLTLIPVAVLAAVLVHAGSLLPNAYAYDVAIRIAMNASLAIGLNLLIGYTGQISLGHAGFFGLGAQGAAGGVVAQCGQQGARKAELGQVGGDIARHAAETFLSASWIRRGHLQRGMRAQLAVEAGGADAQHGALIAQHIGAPQQLALADQARDMACHGRARQGELLGQLLLGDEGVGPDQLIKLFLAGEIGHEELAINICLRC